MELLCGEPLDYGMFGEFGSTLRSDWCLTSAPYFRSTLGDCMLRRAASIGRVESAALLLGHGARLDSELEDWGCLATPLVNACVADHLDMVRLLLDNSAQVDTLTCCCYFESVDDGFEIVMDWTALHAACAWGNLEVVRMLVEHRADVKLCSRYRGDTSGDKHAEIEGPTAFHLACARGHLSIVAFLHAAMGVSIETNGNMYGFSLCGLECVHVWNDVHDCAYLCFPDSYGVRGLDQSNRDDRVNEFPLVYIDTYKLVTGTPLMFACARGNSGVIQYLLDAGADADTRGADGLTTMTLLQAFDHEEAREAMELLLMSAGKGQQGARATPIRTRAQRVGVQLEETPPAVRRDIAQGGPATRARAKAGLRAIQMRRVTRVTRAEQAGTVSAALLKAKDIQNTAKKRGSEPGSRRVCMCNKCGEPKKGHVCKLK